MLPLALFMDSQQDAVFLYNIRAEKLEDRTFRSEGKEVIFDVRVIEKNKDGFQKYELVVCGKETGKCTF